MNTPCIPDQPDGDDHELLPTRRSLLERLGKLDDPSWRDFFQTYWKFIYSTARRANLSDCEAQDVVQETVIYVSRKMPGFTYRAQGSFKAWLNKLIHWRIQDQLRKRQGRCVAFAPPNPGEPDPFLEIPDPAAQNPAESDEEWDRNLLEAAVQKVKEQIKPKQYQIFDLYVMKNWPIRKITSTLGVNFGQVYLAKHRVTALIRQEFQKLQGQY